MSGGVMVTTMFPDSSLIITKNLKLLTMAAFKTFADEFKEIVQMSSTDLKIDKMLRYEGPGTAAEKPEGEAPTQQRMYEGNKETVTQVTFSTEFPITWEQRKYVTKNADFLNQVAQYNARSMKLAKEYTSINLFNLGFSGGETGFDGQQYFSASHTWVSDASTYSNLLANSALGKDALETAFITMVQAQMESSIPAQIFPRKLHIAYENIFELPELLKSIKDPDTGNNTHNVITDYNLKMNFNHYMNSGTNYFVDTDTNTRTMKVSEKTKFDSYIDNPTNNLVERSTSAFGVLFHDQLGTWGSQGGA